MINKLSRKKFQKTEAQPKKPRADQQTRITRSQPKPTRLTGESKRQTKHTPFVHVVDMVDSKSISVTKRLLLLYGN